MFAGGESLSLGYSSQISPLCLIRTRIRASVDDNSSEVFATPGLASSSNGENYIIPLFSERSINSFTLLLSN